MANVLKAILGIAVAAVSITSPALAAHKSKLSSAHQNGYVTQTGQRSGAGAFASVPLFNNPDTGRPYPAGDRTTPFSGGGS